MIDTYFCSTSREALLALKEKHANVIGPDKGREAQDECVLDDQTILPAQPAAGDASLYYLCIRSEQALAPSGDVDVCSTETGRAVLGSWA